MTPDPSRDEETSVFPAIASLSLILHIGVGVLVPNAAPPGERITFESQIILEAPPAPPPPPVPPPPPSTEEAPPAPAPAPARAARATTKPTVLEASTSASDVKLDAIVGETATMPATPPRPEPAPIAAPPPSPAPAPPPRVDPGPVVVPAKALGRLPRAPVLDRELERNYPADARRAGIAGSATLRLQVLSDGRLGRVDHLSESHPGFGQACERTVRAARWDPPLDREGRAVATEIKYVCKFEVRS